VVLSDHAREVLINVLIVAAFLTCLVLGALCAIGVAALMLP
jgi:hypothetical protein